MSHERMKDVMQNNAANVRRFQMWMRENGVILAKADVSEKNTTYQIYADPSSEAEPYADNINMMSFDLKTGDSEMRTMSAADAFSEIVIMSLRTDALLNDMMRRAPFGLSLRAAGPLSVEGAGATSLADGERLH